jgi:hypothetical protein
MLITQTQELLLSKTIGQRVQKEFLTFKPFRDFEKTAITGNTTNEPWFEI